MVTTYEYYGQSVSMNTLLDIGFQQQYVEQVRNEQYKTDTGRDYTWTRIQTAIYSLFGKKMTVTVISKGSKDDKKDKSK